MTKYEGGIGGREGSDLVRWTLDIDDGMERLDTFGSPRPEYVQMRPAIATLTLHDINRAESEAAVQIINEMRSASRGVVLTPSRFPSIGDRFAGLEFENG